MRKIIAVSLALVLLTTSLSGCMFVPKLGSLFGKGKETTSETGSKTGLIDEVTDHLTEDTEEIYDEYTGLEEEEYVYDYEEEYYDNSAHTHYYTSEITVESTCVRNGIRTYRCTCGHSYIENLPKSDYHEWEDATCEKPETCSLCGTTYGEPYGHSYSYDGYCYDCNKRNPVIEKTLAKCSLELPALPKTVSEYDYNDKKTSSVKITAISYEFDCNNSGDISLTVNFSGQKTYDKSGNYYNRGTTIEIKLYAPDGSVQESTSIYTSSLAVGETFANESVELISSWDYAEAGRYRLEISDSYW